MTIITMNVIYAKKSYEQLRHFILLILLIFAGGIIFTSGVFFNRSFYHDDAFISLRYCINLLNGYGLTWNPSERVEGYTNFLYILLIAGATKIGIPLVIASRLVNFVSFGILVYLLIRFCNHFPNQQETNLSLLDRILSIFLIVTSFPLIIWSMGGLEAPLFALLCTAGVCNVLVFLKKERKEIALFLAGIFFSLASLTRPDGIIFMAVATVFLVSRGIALKQVFIKQVGFLVGSFCILFLPHLLWRFFYYGQWVPNTFFVKAIGLPLRQIEQGISYLFRFCITPPFLLPLMILSVIFLGSWRKEYSLYCLITLLVYGGFIVYIGGDHMQGFRLIIPLIPLSILLIQQSAIQWLIRLSPPKKSFLCVVIIFVSSLQIVKPGGFKMDAAAFVGTIIGNYIRENWPRNSLVALNTAGSTPFNAPDHRYIDMLGLNDSFIARRKISHLRLPSQLWAGHAKGDGLYVLSKKPDFIILGPAEGSTAEQAWFLSDLELSESKEFLKSYQKKIVNLDVRSIENYQIYYATYTGRMRFIYYERIGENLHKNE